MVEMGIFYSDKSMDGLRGLLGTRVPGAVPFNAGIRSEATEA